MRRTNLVSALLLLGGLLAPLPAWAQTGDADSENINIADSTVGYIDNAIPGNTLRMRYDTAYNSNRPSRAEYFYATKQPFGPGLAFPEVSIDYQELLFYGEGLMTERLSVFVELGTRFLDPTINPNSAGLGDTQAGFKYAFLYQPNRVGTFQLRTYSPTGASTRGLGTHHVSLEPGLLYYERIDRLTLQGEFKYWIPIDGTDGFAGDVLRYGIGIGYDVVHNDRWWISPVTEFVGWTVLNGGTPVTLAPATVIFDDARGDTILNVKVGTRITYDQNKQFYIGYGRALTGSHWYEDILRLEYRLTF
ncbi:MAG: hypothetical protein AB7K24_20060 [Gemmataceae bacterium]